MKIVNAGVLREPGSFTFYRNRLNSAHSSFVRQFGNKGDWEEITVRCVTMRELIAEHGKPFFMKVDIEGADLQALASLTPTECPDYISLELGNSGEEILDRLIELGYSAFKFVDGGTHWCTREIADGDIGWRLLRKAGRIAPFIRKGICKLPQRFRDRAEWNLCDQYNPDSYNFGPENSGPFGERASGEWRKERSARSYCRRLRRYSAEVGQKDWIWWDVHARHSSAVIHN
jgi:hypothetical protein